MSSFTVFVIGCLMCCIFVQTRGYREEKVWGVKRPQRSNSGVVGDHHCTWGPGYWCESEATADECGTREYCEEKIWGAKRPKRSNPGVVGDNHCTWGPGYWCQSEATADECETREFCEEKVWEAKRPKRSKPGVVGDHDCSWGPGYWCESEATADKCGAREYCEKVWGAKRLKRNNPVVGDKECTWGPAYWCENEATADECGVCIKFFQDLIYRVFLNDVLIFQGVSLGHFMRKCKYVINFSFLNRYFLISQKIPQILFSILAFVNGILNYLFWFEK